MFAWRQLRKAITYYARAMAVIGAICPYLAELDCLFSGKSHPCQFIEKNGNTN
jgi:hypothetical protein